jgi:hypothetical protein
MEWGTLADWSAAAAAALAVVYAARAARDSRRLARREADRDAAQQASARRAQAELVTSWVAVRLDVDGKVVSSGVVIQNASTTPVFDVCVRANGKTGAALAPLRLSVLPPGEFFTASSDSTFHWEFPDATSSITGTMRPVMKKPEWRVDEMVLTDSSSQRWRRDAKGMLAPAGTEDA